MNLESLLFLERELNVRFPEGTAAIFARFQTELDGNCGFRVMTVEEVLDACNASSGDPYLLLPPGFLPLWTDDESNYAALCIEEPLSGKISLIDHEQSFDFAPAFRSTSSFLTSLKRCKQGAWWDIPLDYPQEESEELQPADNSALEWDWQVVQCLRPTLEREGSERKRIFFACAIIVMTPFAMAHTLLSFLDSPNAQVCANACCICGLRKVQAAIPKLKELAMMRPELLGYALDGLGLMKSKEGLRVILDLRKHYPRHQAAFARALQLHGWEVQKARE